MLKSLIAFFAFFQIASFANSTLFPMYETKLISTHANEGVVKDNDALVVGSSGIVMHTFNDGQSTIIARAVVTKKQNNQATVRFEVFDLVAQNAFPLPGILPQKNDKVILNYLYNRALIVVPNEPIFNEVTKHYNNITWIHPDIIASQLISSYKPNPDKKDFNKMCNDNTAGMIFFALDNYGYFADCKSLDVLKTIKTGAVSSYELPFYNRLGGVESVFWKLDGRQITNYDNYYSNLLGL